MSETFFEPLAAGDRQFLEIEDANRPMHVSGISEYELDPLRSEDGSVDIARVRKAIEGALHKIPIYRQKLAWTPIERAPVWVDADDFELDHHVRHLAVPAPGSPKQLKELTGFIISLPLDRARPLWEMWFIDGLEGSERFAVVTKLHHCMVDGASGMNLLSLLLRDSADYTPRTARSWTPRRAPGDLELATSEVAHRLSTPVRLLRAARHFQAENPNLAKSVYERLTALGFLLRQATRRASALVERDSETPHRRVDWMETPLDELASFRRSLGCTLNELVLTIVTGAVRRYLRERGTGLDRMDYRVMVPVNVRRADEREKRGNRVSSWFIRLPLEVADPLKQLEAIRRESHEARDNKRELGVELLTAISEEVPLARLLGPGPLRGQVSTVVTNVPGPPKPLYLMGSRAITMQPFVVLPPGVGLAVALLSYDGRLFWGFTMDEGYGSDVEALCDDVRASLSDLEKRSRPTSAN